MPLAAIVNGVYFSSMLHEEASVPRDRRHRANLERILDAASRIVFEEGVDALSIKRVADRADYTAGALYRYFPSKDALLAGVVVRTVDGLGARLREASDAATNPLGSIVAQTRAYRAFAHDEPHAFALVAAMVSDPRHLVADDDAAAEVFVAVLRAMEPVKGALLQAAASGALETGDANERALSLFVSIQGAMQLRKLESRAPTLVRADAVFDTTLHALLRGFGASDRRLRDAMDATEQGRKRRKP